MNLTNSDYILLVSGLLSLTTFLGLIILKRYRKSTIYRKLRLNHHKIYRLGQICLAIFTFSLTLFSGSQLFHTKNSLNLLIWSYTAITSLQIFWWNLTYNSQEDPFSPLFLKKGKITKSARKRAEEAQTELFRQEALITAQTNKIKALSESDLDEKVKSIAKEYLEIFLRLENLVRNKYELEHLYRLYEGEKQPRKIVFSKRKSFLAELQHLRTLGLIENQPDKTIGGMPQSGDLRDYVKLTQDGIDYIESRERYGLANPRREKNSEFWSSANNN